MFDQQDFRMPAGAAPSAAARPVPKSRPLSGRLPVSVIGLGYVGAVSTACLSDLGHHVIGVDVDYDKVKTIGAGYTPIHEAGLGALLAKGVAEDRIMTTVDTSSAVRNTDITFLSVGTPTSADGGCDYRFIKAAAQAIGGGIKVKSTWHTVVMRCSIPPGTTMNVMVPEIERVSGKKCGEDFGVCFNPEFLREGVAVDDFYNPPKTVIGASDDYSAHLMADLFRPVDDAPILTSIETAEMVKYVDNVWHAMKVTFGNEIGRLCKPLGVDSHAVMDIFVQDTKLNLSPYYLKPGFAFGGSCLPKEVRAVVHLAEDQGVDIPTIRSLTQSNTTHIEEATRMVEATGAKTVAVLGLAFKPGTDDLRESPILEVIAALMERGIKVVAHDPAVTPETNIKGQLGYVRHAASGLAKVAEGLGEMLEASAGRAVEQADA
ncbi:MAG: nucleotide sugar dehydrogenase, partial [Pseudomonadota bacterium]